MPAIRIVNRGRYGILDVLGPTVEFLTAPGQADAPNCIIIGTIPPGVCVPLHSHQDPESFYVLSGTVEALNFSEDPPQWTTIRPGVLVEVPPDAKHAFRNTAGEPVVELIVTTPNLGRFFQEVGRPVRTGQQLPTPTPSEIDHFLNVARRFGYWNATPDENAAVGIDLMASIR